MNDSLVIYEDGELELKVNLQEETIWLTQKQIVELFNKDQSVISRHISNIFKDKEIDEESNMQKMHIANSDKPVKFYSLDIVLAVGYRTNSKKAIEFRKWATKILKEYIFNGYAINKEKITQLRLSYLEKDVSYIKSHIKNNTLELKQGIFYDGEIYDAYVFINDILKHANREVILIDNYSDDTVLTLFSKYKGLNFTIITQKISKQLKLDIEKYNTQYNNLTIKTSPKYHDRFLIIDYKEAYHIGASLKDLGKKVFRGNFFAIAKTAFASFGFSKMDIALLDNIIGEVE